MAVRIPAETDLRAGMQQGGNPSGSTPRHGIRQSERVMTRVSRGSGMRWRHSRPARSIPGIERCLRKESLDIPLLGLCMFRSSRMAGSAQKGYGKNPWTFRNRLIMNEKKI